jgi:cytochrome c oxidase cbb3-type subunit 3
MCSASKRRSPLRALGVACVIAAAGCRAPSEPAAVSTAPPVVDVAVGPIPGVMLTDDEGPPNPFADDKAALAEGRRFFVQYNCSGCHGDHGGGGMGPSLRDRDWIYGGSHARVARSIADGRAYGMPAWGKSLTPAQIWQITAYLKSMRTPHEPRPPVQ